MPDEYTDPEEAAQAQRQMLLLASLALAHDCYEAAYARWMFSTDAESARLRIHALQAVAAAREALHIGARHAYPSH